MIIEDRQTCDALRRIVSRLTADPTLQQDLLQEGLLRLWGLERELPGRSKSWYLQNCRFHLQHWLAAGRSVDSLKRSHAHNRLPIEGDDDDAPLSWYHTNGELFETVCVRDTVSSLAGHLKPRERAVLDGLADGLVLREIAHELRLSYPTALKSRRTIAVLTIKLGIAPSSRLEPRAVVGSARLGLPALGSRRNAKKAHRISFGKARLVVTRLPKHARTERR